MLRDFRAFALLALLALLALPALLVAGAPGAAIAASTAASTRPTLPLYTVDEIPVVCDKAIAAARASLATIESLPLPNASVKTVLHAINRMQIIVEDVESPVYLLSNAHPDKAVRDAAEECLLKFSAFGTDWLQSEKLYRRVVAVKVAAAPDARRASSGVAGAAKHPAAGPDAKLKKDLIESFEDTGVALPPAKRERMKSIIQRLEELRQEFERNMRDNPAKLTFTPAEMRGLPASYLDKAKRDANGNYVLGFEYPEFYPFMTNADDEDARRRYQFAFTNRGTPRNVEVLAEVTRLRHEIAGLFGMKSFAEFSLRRKMARSPDAVRAFLDGVKSTVREVATKDVEAMRALKAQLTGKPVAEVKINNWDSAYYRDKLRKTRHDIDREALRDHFPTDASIDWVLHISATLYGVRFDRVPSVPVWHSDVSYYDVVDTQHGAFLGGIYLDLFPRDGKFSHAANYGVRSTSRLQRRTPYGVLIANLDRKGLDNVELETLVHEFGHALHHVFARTDYVSHGGSGLEWDFVEAPSQMYEEWARRYESLRLIERHCGGRCRPLDRDLVERMEAARRIGIGLRYVDQHLLADYDLTLYGAHDGRPPDPQSTWARMEGETPLGHTPGTQFPGTFDHIVRGYAAGYYGYMWSEVLALDMLSMYGTNIMNPAVGRRFRATVLSPGGERPAAAMVEQFLRRKPSNAAFIAEITGRRMVR